MQIQNVGKSLHTGAALIYEKSNSVSIMECVGLQKSCQMYVFKLKENIAPLDSDLATG